MTPALLAAVLAARAGRRLCVVATHLADGMQRLFVAPVPASSDPVQAAAAACIACGRSHQASMDGAAWFLHLHAPPPRLLVIGAVHIAQSLVPMALLLGADVTLCDPRRRYATAERFPHTRLCHDWPDQAVRVWAPEPPDAVIALSHDPKLDDPALAAALDTPCAYIGALGSTRSHAARLVRLVERGVPAGALGRIRGPVGLDIGALGAAEIAVSIVAEWIALRHGGGRRPAA